jgi:hypothetical protein
MKSVNLNFLDPLGHSRPVTGLLYSSVCEPVNEVSVLVRGVEFLDKLNKFQLLRKELLLYY